MCESAGWYRDAKDEDGINILLFLFCFVFFQLKAEPLFEMYVNYELIYVIKCTGFG